MMYSGEKPWDPITLDVWPADDSTGTVYQDDETTTAFTKGESTTTTFHCVEQAGKNVAFTITPSNQKFGPNQWVARFHLTSVPTAVTLDGAPLSAASGAVADTGWAFDAASGTLTVKLPGQHAVHALAITLDGSSHPRPAAPKVDASAMGGTSAAVEPREIAQFLPPPKLPIRIEAANFDKGGEGLAFHVAHPTTGAVYRQEGAPIINSTDAGGGYAIPDLQQGDWLAYTLDAYDGGWFAISARALPSSDGTLLFLRDRNKLLTSVVIPAPGPSAPTWTSVPGQSLFYLPPGEQILTARVAKPGFQFGNFTFTKAGDAVVTVEAESGTMKGVGVKHDHPGYMGSGFVAGIGSKATSVTMRVTVPSDGKYLVALRYANGADDAQVALTPSGSASISVSLPATDAWDHYAEAGAIVVLQAGPNDIQVTGADVGVVNIDQLKLITPP